MGNVLNDFRPDVLRQRVLRNASLLYAALGQESLSRRVGQLSTTVISPFQVEFTKQKKKSHLIRGKVFPTMCQVWIPNQKLRPQHRFDMFKDTSNSRNVAQSPWSVMNINARPYWQLFKVENNSLELTRIFRENIMTDCEREKKV